jgi:multimeric flavodoxin WrbA
MSRSPVILAIAGSTRRHGNSEAFLDAFLGGVKAAGGPFDKVVVAERDIHACRGCDACSLTGECIIHDDMQDLYERLDAAAAVVVSTPVFFATVPSVLKAFYDRMQPYWARRYVLKQPAPDRRPGAILVVRGGQDPYGFQEAVWPTKSVFAVLGIESLGEIKLEGVDSPGDLGGHPDALDEARELGRRLAQEVTG